MDMKKLLEVMATLRDPTKGCPWDLEQDFASIAPYTVEEAYEVADAIEREDMSGLRDELGDLLLQVVFHARMAEEAGLFAFSDVVESIVGKMVRRHPHVFGELGVDDAEQVTRNWENIKAAERGGGVLSGIAKALPALKRAQKLGKRAARVGFDWSSIEGVLLKIEEEQAELALAMDSGTRDSIAAEFGDLLFSVAQLGRHLDLDAEDSLRQANRRFSARFEGVERRVQEAGGAWERFSPEELESFWAQAKREVPPNL